ncbi:Gamma-butyrobetaine dioxygenase [Ceratocystis lukuohia]|uniref:Gamma-butyrobetaine dioxygenase n=1 Tax=Ceratocystis lukuohia TaxID=2019550 RepID=A0ABR4MDA2_9PEZI
MASALLSRTRTRVARATAALVLGAPKQAYRRQTLASLKTVSSRRHTSSYISSTIAESASPSLSSAWDGPTAHIPAKLVAASVFLRDACRCPHCVTPSSGQKTFGTFDIPADIRPRHVDILPDFTLRITWTADVASAPHGHVSEYSPQYLRSLQLKRAGKHEDQHDFRAPQRAVGMKLWDGAAARQHVQRIPYAEFMDTSDDSGLWRALLDLEALGLVFLTDVPRDKESVARIGLRINTLQETFYGRTWDVVSKPQAENVAYTAGFLGLHQDMLYVQQPPRIQLLHCMVNSATGGESLFSDARLAAQKLLDRSTAGDTQAARYVQLLADFRVRYHYTTPPFTYRNSWPVLQFRDTFDSRGVSCRELDEVWWSPPFQAPNPPADPQAEGISDLEAERRSREWLQALQVLRGLIEHPDHVYETKMGAGDCALFDNRRVLHARRAFDTASGERWLRGTYISDEDFRSKMHSVPRDRLQVYAERMGLPVLVNNKAVKGERTVLEYLQAN